MIHALAPIALAQLLPDEPPHHAAHPLLADDGIARVVQRLGVFEVDAVVGWGDGGLLGLEGLGFGGGHCIDSSAGGGSVGTGMFSGC